MCGRWKIIKCMCHIACLVFPLKATEKLPFLKPTMLRCPKPDKFVQIEQWQTFIIKKINDCLHIHIYFSFNFVDYITSVLKKNYISFTTRCHAYLLKSRYNTLRCRMYILCKERQMKQHLECAEFKKKDINWCWPAMIARTCVWH